MTQTFLFRRLFAVLVFLAALAAPLSLRAASTGTTALQTPQGGSTATDNGEYISTTRNSPYHYWIEVPAGLGHLTVEVYDADIGRGTNEDDAGRDRERGNSWNSPTVYTLLRPDGTTAATLNCSNTTCTDNAWNALLDSAGETFRDNFGTAAYTNNDGSLTWATNWTESNDDNNAGNGQIRITGGELRIGDNGGAASIIQRGADLSGFTSATLSFDARTTGVDAGDQLVVEASSDGGASWSLIRTFNGAVTDATYTNDLTPYIAANTRIRFRQVTGYGTNDFLFVDNLQIQVAPFQAGHWELRVDMSGNTGDDINAIGIRANDGDSTSGGTELPVYIDSIVPLGVNPPASGSLSRSYPLYPYITSGCTASTNDFDYDSDSGTVGSYSFSSRTGAFTQSIASAALSTDDTWKRNTINRWTSDQAATEYGIWSGAFAINTYVNAAGINGNYTDVYLGNFQVSGTVAPSANPQPNSFRIYLPTDAGTAPVKPYLEQLLTYSGCGTNDGPNPPVVGQTSCYTVTVRLVNPTASPINFSATDLVTANVPASGAVVYAGIAQVSQGSVVSEPTIGGTGNITWNPGMVAAGSTQLLAYRVKVTPTSAGQRIPVTGTPALNGTRATYLDETGNTTQARATFTFGPLCELATTQGLLTEAVVSGFQASPADGGGVLLEWRTASEAATAGFYVQRWDVAARRWVRVNRELLAGVQAPQGGTYRFVDPGASPYEPPSYRLVEVEAGGGRRAYGPFAARIDWDRTDPRAAGAGFEREVHATVRRAVPSAGLAVPELKGVLGDVPRGGATAGADGAYLGVRRTGLYYLSTASVAGWLGMTSADAASAIARGMVSLTHGGAPVAWYPDLAAAGGKKGLPAASSAQGLFFYGEAPDSLYTDTGVYRLQQGSGRLMQAVTAGPAAPAAGGSFPATLHAEKDLFAATVLPLDPDSDYWFWDFLQGNDPASGQKSFPLDVSGAIGGAGGTLTVHLQGATASGVAGEHRVQVALNGTALGETSWTGITAHSAAFSVPAGALLPDGNQVQITAIVGDGAPYSIFYVDSFDLSYPRSFQASGDSLAFTGGGNAQVTVTGFSSPAVRLLDVQDPRYPRWITGAAVDADGAGGYQLSLVPAAAGRYFAAAPAAVAAPAASRPWSPTLRTTANAAEYLVIAPPALRDAAERLANLRRAQGMTAMVVDLDQIMDTFNAGASDPHALRAFLSFAHTQWVKPPRYVVLAGEGTVDYRNLLGYGDNLMPPLMIDNDGGLFPSDNLLGDVDGDGFPEVAVGRIPALSAAELDAYTAKITAYESAGPAAWTGTAVMTSDAVDQGADFRADSDQVAGQLSSVYTVSHIDLSSTPLAAARAQLLGAFGGAAFINYMGHGALDRLSSGGLLTVADVPGLANGGRLPVMTAMTCTVNRFAVPGALALGELLVKSGAGGAAAVWGPAGLSSSGEAKLLAERFYHAGDARLGDRVLRAIGEYRALGGDANLPPVYDLLGDPALRLQMPPPPTVTSSTTTE
jgi:hypothetical protein